MVVKRTCSFCAGELEPGTGTMFVRRDGQVLYFCSTVCRRDMTHLNRVGHRLKWTTAYSTKKVMEKTRSRAEAQAKGEEAKPAPAAAKKAPAKPKSANPTAKPAQPKPQAK